MNVVPPILDAALAGIDEAIQNALDKVVGEDGTIQYEAKPLNEISTLRPNTGNVNMNNKRIENLPDPSESHHAVTKTYCDNNSGKDPSGAPGTIFNTVFGAIAGALGGTLASLSVQGIGSAVGSLAGAGVAAIGTFAGTALAGGLLAGTSNDLDVFKISNQQTNPEVGALIDNLKNDIASRPDGQADAGSLIQGAMSVQGLFRAVRNAQVGLFDLET